MRVRIRFLPTVITGVVLLVLLSVGTIFSLNLAANRSIFMELGGRAIENGLDRMELAIRDYLDAASHQAEFVAKALATGQQTFSESERLSAFIAGSLAAAPQVSGITVVDRNGMVLRAERTDAGNVDLTRKSLTGDSQLRDIVAQSQGRTEPHWPSPVYFGEHKETFLSLRFPVRRDGEYLGLVVVRVSTLVLSELVTKLSAPPRATVFVLYGRESVLAHMYLTLHRRPISKDKPLLATGEITDPVIEKLERAKPILAPNLISLDEITVRRIHVGNIRYLVFEKAIADYTDLPLYIGAYSTSAAVDNPARIMLRAIVAGAVILLLALLAGVIMSRMITRPIRESSASAQAVASLNFEDASPLRASWITEIDDLATSFNAMLVGLKSFGRYLPRSLVAKLIRENRVGAGTEERDLTVMFTDIAEFTSTCEGLTPQEVAAFVNHHLGLVSACIEREGGTIDKYIGDAVMAFWGAPDTFNDSALRAGRAAVAIQAAIAADNEVREQDGLPPVRIRIGIHGGPLIVGDIGSPGRINYTVVGDVVNAAQRLEGLGKEIDPRAESIILVSSWLYDALNSAFTLEKIGPLKIKGKQTELEVYRILSGSASASAHGVESAEDGAGASNATRD